MTKTKCILDDMPFVDLLLINGTYHEHPLIEDVKNDLGQGSSSGELYIGRACPCKADQYCLHGDFCTLEGDRVNCYKQHTSKQKFSILASRVSAMWLLCMFFFLLVSKNGRKIGRHIVYKMILPICQKGLPDSFYCSRLKDMLSSDHYLDRAIDAQIQNEILQRRELVEGMLRESGIEIERSDIENRAALPRIQLVMRTKSFRRPCAMDGDKHSLDVDDYSCAICLCEIEDGDRVGKLTCKVRIIIILRRYHVFCRTF